MREIYVKINKPEYKNMGMIELDCLLFYMCGPLEQGYTAIKPLSVIFLCWTRLAVSVVLMTCLDVLAGEAVLLWGC